MSERPYEGSELELFAQATNWKAYWSRRLRPFVRGRVLEVGAGLGSNTELLLDAAGHWTCLEPDGALLARARALHERHGARVAHLAGTLADVGSERRFDTLLYLDVLEHIADDAAELARAVGCLDAGGRVVVLAPAHQALYSPFDRAIGHHRRYDARSLRALTPADATLERLEYLDSAGLAASWANRALLRQSLPTLRQVRTWDRLFVPLSRLVDPCLGRRVGKSVLAVWRAQKGGVKAHTATS